MMASWKSESLEQGKKTQDERAGRQERCQVWIEETHSTIGVTGRGKWGKVKGHRDKGKWDVEEVMHLHGLGANGSIQQDSRRVRVTFGRAKM